MCDLIICISTSLQLYISPCSSVLLFEFSNIGDAATQKLHPRTLYAWIFKHRRNMLDIFM